MILGLSYPKSNSLNDHVTKDLFDGTVFTLKLPSIDGITHDIINTENHTVLFKVDVARADSLKF